MNLKKPWTWSRQRAAILRAKERGQTAASFAEPPKFSVNPQGAVTSAIVVAPPPPGKTVRKRK